MNRYAVILAAGKGTRMKSLNNNVSKVSFPILGQPLVQYVLDSLKPLGLEKTVVVVGFGGETSSKIVENQAEVVWQHEQKGTGHAVMMATPVLGELEGQTIVCCGDTPLLRAETLKALFEYHEENGNAMTVMTSKLDNPFGYGRIHKTNGNVDKIIEQKDCNEEETKINEVNAGVYVYDNKLLFNALNGLTTNNAAGEYYLTDVLEILVKNKQKVGSFAVDFDETLGVNDRRQLATAGKILRQRINEQHMINGVTIEDPDTTYIAPHVTIGQDTVIAPNVSILGDTTIGQENYIGANTVLENVTIADGNEIFNSTISDTSIGNGCHVGPYARLRNKVILEDSVIVGSYVEIKNTNIQDKSSIAHLSFVGDASIGQHSNIGGGTITANYDGSEKFKTTIKDDVFVGANNTLVAPITLGNGAYTAAGSTIVANVDDECFAVARGKQANKEDWKKFSK